MRDDLRADSQGAANYFFWAAGLAALSSGLFSVSLNIIVNIGVFDLLRAYGGSLGQIYPFVAYGVVASWLVVFIILGIAARSGQRWAFLIGMVLYAADMVALVAMFSIWAFGLHSFFLLKWYQGQKALKDLGESSGDL